MNTFSPVCCQAGLFYTVFQIFWRKIRQFAPLRQQVMFDIIYLFKLKRKENETYEISSLHSFPA